MQHAPLHQDLDPELPSPRSRIKYLRSLSGLTQSDFARACGIARTYVGLIESGSRKEIGVSKLAAIAITCGVSLDYLVLGDGADPARRHVPTAQSVQRATLEALTNPASVREKVNAALGSMPRRTSLRRTRRPRAKTLPRRLSTSSAARADKNEPPAVRAGGRLP